MTFERASHHHVPPKRGTIKSPPLFGVLFIDPGSEQSGWVLYDVVGQGIMHHGLSQNDNVRKVLYEERSCQHIGYEHIVIEVPQPRGQMMTTQLVTTIIWIGRFIEAWRGEWEAMDRAVVKMHLCGRTTAKDSNVRQALIDRFPQTGGGKTPSIGTKKQPGPLYGVKKDIWSALAMAVTWVDQNNAGVLGR